MITGLKVLNTVTALGADLVYLTGGNIALSTLPKVKGSQITGITILAPVVEIKEVWTITPTATNSYIYTMVINGYSKSTGNSLSVPLSVTSDASATATEICDLFRAALLTNNDINVVGSGTTTLVLTATGISSTTPSLSQLACFQVGSNDTNLSPVNTTDGVPSIGLDYQLAADFPPPLQNAKSGYPDILTLTSGYYYTQVTITYEKLAQTGSNQFAYPTNTNSQICLIKTGTTATPTIANFATLASSWGTLAQLAAGYKGTIVAVGANVSFGSNVAVRASGSFITEQLVPGDIIAISDGLTTATNGTANVVLPYSDGTTAANFIFANAYTDNANTVAAAAAFVIHKANLPL